jgi:hypothetical protein
MIYSVYYIVFIIKLLSRYTKVKNGFRCKFYACIIKCQNSVVKWPRA